MDKPSWELAKRLFHEALEETGPDRMKVLEAACGEDRELLAQVAALIQAYDQAGDFLSEENISFRSLGSDSLTAEEDEAPRSDQHFRGPEVDREGESEAELPARLGPYEILGVLGMGGMGTVYRARDPDLQRDLAIKVLPADLATRSQVARFEREARLLASLNHPNIATIHAFGETDGRPYLVLELIEGQALSQRLETGPLPLEEAVDLGCQIAGAIEAAHEAGIVHRDLKPANIMITPRGLAKVLDFGIAKGTRSPRSLPPEEMEITSSGILIGTIPYLSPEQVVGKRVDERSDLWALGCLLFEVLTGRSPFQRTDSGSTLLAIRKEAPDLAALPSGTPAELKNLISECLEKDPENRPVSARVVRGLLSDTLTGLRNPDVGAWSQLTPMGGAVWAFVGIMVTIAVLSLAQQNWLRSLIGLMPPNARAFMADGGVLAVLAIVALGSLLLGVRLLPRVGPGLVRWRRKPAFVAAAAILGLAMLYASWRWVPAHIASAGADSIDVYVSLPFQGLDDEDTEYLLSISTRYRETLETVFSDVETVNILPESYDPEVMRAFPPQCTFQRVGVWISESRLQPDLVICNNVNVFSDMEGETGLRVVSSLQKTHNQEMEFVGRIESLGSDAEVRYLALWTGARILETLHQEQFLQLKAEEEEAVLGRILEEYSLFLSLLGDSASEVAGVVDDLREAGSLFGSQGVREVVAALDVYETTVSLDEDEVWLSHLREALLKRVGGIR